MNRVSRYKKLETGETIDMIRVGQYYHDLAGKVYYEKEVKVLYKFCGFVHERETLVRCETYTTVNHFKVRRYVRKNGNA